MDVGLVSPGAMGAATGSELVAVGHAVRWASLGRSDASKARARAARLQDAGSLAALRDGCSVLLSICPPQAALDVARSVAGFEGIYVDANAIAPATAANVARIVERGGAVYVDGSVIGPPPAPSSSTSLYLSGERAPEIAALFERTAVDAIVLDGDRMAASALKMAFAAWAKGSAALLLAAHEAAVGAGVERALEREWAHRFPDLRARFDQATEARTAKGWRWGPEMREIALALAALGLPTGFHDAAAAMFERAPR